MRMHLKALAKSDKRGGYCVAALDTRGKVIRLPRDKEGRALREEQCKFEKLDHLIADINLAPLKHQKENYVLNQIIELSKSSGNIEDFKKYLHRSPFVFLNTNPWLFEEEMYKLRSTFMFVEVNDLYVYKK